jgi:hypothetical protein
VTSNPKKNPAARRKRRQFPNQKRTNENPFKRAREKFGEIKAALLQPEHGRRLALAEIAPYESRGHGRGRLVGLGRRLRDRSKYSPRVEDRKHAQQRVIQQMGVAPL